MFVSCATGTQELDMVMPPTVTSVRDICKNLGMNNYVNVLEVSSRSVKDITVEEWCNYFEKEERGDNDLRLSELHITSTDWGANFSGPRLLKQLDWGCMFNIHCLKGAHRCWRVTSRRPRAQD